MGRVARRAHEGLRAPKWVSRTVAERPFRYPVGASIKHSTVSVGCVVLFGAADLVRPYSFFAAFAVRALSARSNAAAVSGTVASPRLH